MNQFQYLTGPCLVCKRQKRGIAWGITPDRAVCDDCYVDEPEKTAAAIEVAEKQMDQERKKQAQAQQKKRAAANA